MANEKRRVDLLLGGTVSDNPLTSGASTINSDGLAAILGGIGSTEHMDIIIDPDGDGGTPEVARLTAVTAGATSGTISRNVDANFPARQHEQGTEWVHALTPVDVKQLLGITEYDPGSATTYTITSSTSVALDATNIAVAFTAPPSGKVLVVLTALCDCAATNYLQWGLRESGADVSGSYKRVLSLNSQVLISSRHLITGLTPGSAHTFAWGAFTDGSVTAHIYTDSGGAGKHPKTLMEVWAVLV